MADDPDQSPLSPATAVHPVHLRANKPSPRGLWATLLFFLSFLVTAVALTVVAPGGELTKWAFLFSLVLSLLVWLVSFSNYCLELTILPDRLRLMTRRKKIIYLAFTDIRLVSVESRLNLNDASIEQWGCLFLVTEKQRYGFLFPSGTVVGTYNSLVQKIPSALGIGGDYKIDLPALTDPSSIPIYLMEHRQALAKELRRAGTRTSTIFLFVTLILGAVAFIFFARPPVPPAPHLRAFSRAEGIATILAIVIALWAQTLRTFWRRAKILAAFNAALSGHPLSNAITRQQESGA